MGTGEMNYGDLSYPLTSFSGIMIINWDPSLDSNVIDISDEGNDYVLKALYVARTLSLEPKLYTLSKESKMIGKFNNRT